jgi:phosphosulfolactate synthase
MKISMACWQVASESVTRRKIKACRTWNVPSVTGGGPFEVAVAQGALEEYLDLCADMGVDRIECGEGFTELDLPAERIMKLAKSRGLEVQYELGEKHSGAFTEEAIEDLISQGKHWLNLGAVELVIEARESAKGVGLFDDAGNFNAGFAERFADTFGLGLVTFEAPNKPSQFTLLNHFGPMVRLSNIRLEELLRVEIYRRGLHSDAFQHANLRPVKTAAARVGA